MNDGSSPIKPAGGPARTPQQASIEQKLRKVSQDYEKHFLQEMTKAMRATVHEGGFIKQNSGEKLFREMLDEQYVDRWNEKGGIGLSNLIYDQLMEKFGARLGLRASEQRPAGPLPLTVRSNYAGRVVADPAPEGDVPAKRISYRFDRGPASRAPADVAPDAVSSPWSGIFLGGRRLEGDQQLLEIAHDNGLKSRLVFKGSAENRPSGTPLQAGETLGFLGPDAKALFWTVQEDGKAAQDLEKAAAE